MDDLVRAQQEEILTLRERIRQLEDLLLPASVPVPIEWNLPRCEARIFVMLTQRDVVTKEALRVAMYGDRYDGKDYPEELVESHVCKLRKRVRPFGVRIVGKRFSGYSLIDRHRYLGRETHG